MNTEKALVGVLVGLALKACLDAAYKDPIASLKAPYPSGLATIIRDPASIQVLVLLVTVIRFVFGTNRVFESVERIQGNLEWWTGILNLSAAVILFVLLYLTALSVKNPIPFYLGLALVHICDLVWFLCFRSSQTVADPTLERIIQSFLLIDSGTFILLFCAAWLATRRLVLWGALIMLVSSVVDFWVNYKFYFGVGPFPPGH